LSNFIGTNAAGTGPLANGAGGVEVFSGAPQGNVIGTPAAGNIIADNNGYGVLVANGATGTSIRGNALFANAGLGIDLSPSGVTANDSLGHNGPNHYQDFPVFSSVLVSGGTATIQGKLGSSPSTSYILDFYANS